MSWRTRTTHSRLAQPFKRWLRSGAVLMIGLALAVAACGTSTSGGGGQTTPTPTSKPTATATPVPCTGWRIVSSLGGMYPMSVLSSVSALSPTAAWAVGVNYSVGDTIGPVDSLIEQWDGSAWHLVASGSSGHSALNGVAAISPTDIWAVGGRLYYSGVGAGTVTMHWDGTAWSVVPSVQPADAKSVSLYGVAAIASNDVWAVGSQWPGADQLTQPLVEHWNGANWHLISAPLPQSAAPTRGGNLTAATRIPGTQQLWAVGGWQEWVSTAPPQPLIERWDGTTWQIVPSPALPADAMGGSWNGVVALSATNAWAVGRYALKNPMDSHPLIAHWDGTSWQIVVASPGVYGELDSVAAAGATDVRAAGSRLTGSGASSGNGQRVPLIEQWNGTAWQIITTPEVPNGAISGSLSIATDGSGNYWAVGSYLSATSGNGQYQTLSLHCP